MSGKVRPNYGRLSIYLVGVFMGALDTNVLGPAFPLIAGSFRVGLSWTAWTITAYTVAYVSATVLAGASGDRFGRKPLFVGGIAAFGLASALAVWSPTFWLFLVARAIQGMGAGMVFPNAQAEGIAAFPQERKGMALGLFGAVFGLASIIGPNVGGVLAQFLGWRAIFVLNVPIALVVLLASARLPAGKPTRRPLPDWVAGMSFSLMLASALLVLMVSGWWRAVALVAALLLFALFRRRQAVANQPFLDMKPLSGRGGRAIMIGAGLIGLDMAAAVFVPTLTQRVFGFSVLDSGFALMPAAFTGAILAGVGGHLVDRRGPRLVITIGLAAGAVGGLILAWPHLTFLMFIVAMCALGLGTAFTMGAPLNRMAIALYSEEQTAEALSLMAVFRAVGLAAGPVLLTLAQGPFGFSGMFGEVFVASAIGVALFQLVPDVRPVRRGAEA